ncbi:DoxX family protein [Aestuariimicrobium sp. Y1814]|uniref:DoxX family protein n=1 Tax=Aestuariimicrobium sp. Y1814 TaxID=3418742 RepID=UPI003DA73E8C
MSLLRFVGRAALASYFVYEGVKAVTKPEQQVEAADPIAQRVVPLAQKAVPASVAPYLPEQTKTLVQLSGATQVVGGLAFATGVARRLGAGLLALTQLGHVVASVRGLNSDEKSAGRAKLLRNVALFGATLLAAQDTQGKPSLGWRAEDATTRLSRAADKKAKAISKDASKLSRKAKKELRQAKKQLESGLSS